jgi:hypothetical protein
MKCFRCARTGLYYPADYVEQWGRRFGLMLGKQPVSEALTNEYNAPVVDGKIPMHPLSVCKAQMDFVDVPEEEYLPHRPVIAADDSLMKIRADIMRAKQYLKSQELKTKYPTAAAAAERDLNSIIRNYFGDIPERMTIIESGNS